ncbi:hypothetical protein GCM10022245_74010 [Streptomyces mayteni]
MPEPPLVLEGQPGGLVEVDVRLRGAVEQQLPAARPVRVGHQLGEAAGHHLAHALAGRAAAPPSLLRHAPSLRVRWPRGRDRSAERLVARYGGGPAGEPAALPRAPGARPPTRHGINLTGQYP